MIKPENELEEKIISDPEFIQGVKYGKPRRGHPEGEVIYHIEEILNNIDKFYNKDIIPFSILGLQESDKEDRRKLRLIALIHDTFKFKVDRNKPKFGENHHGFFARKFAEKYISDEEILQIIELHDDAYNAWNSGERNNNWHKAEERAEKLIKKIKNHDLYLDFYKFDNETGDKSQAPFQWFKLLLYNMLLSK